MNFEETPGFYAGITYVNCLCWYIYGDFLYSDKIKYIYLIGAIINFIFVFIYLFYEIRKYKQDAILNGLIIISGTYMIYVGLTIVIDNVDVIAKICFASYSILFLFPMHIICCYYKQKLLYYTIIFMLWDANYFSMLGYLWIWYNRKICYISSCNNCYIICNINFHSFKLYGIIYPSMP